MPVPDENNDDELKAVSHLRKLLQSDVHISQPKIIDFSSREHKILGEQEGVELSIRVANQAEDSESGGHVVFVGVGLRLSDKSEPQRPRPRWAGGIKKSRPSDRQDIRRSYETGTWIGAQDNGFPALTSNEKHMGGSFISGRVYCV